MKWSIVTDSSCDLNCLENTSWDVRLAEVPFTLRIGQRDFVDTRSLDVAEMLDAMENCPEASFSACPAPGAWQALFEEAENTIAITISGNLSGSYNSAVAARQMVLDEHPEKKIFILDSRSAGSALAMYAEKAAQWISEGCGFDAVTARLEEYAAARHTVFALASFSNLIKNGRMSRLAGLIAGKLGIWGIGVASEDGKIVVKGKTRGGQHILHAFLKDMKEHDFDGGEVVISHCQNQEMAERLRDAVLEQWPQAKVKLLPTGGLCSYYAERRGMIVAY